MAQFNLANVNSGYVYHLIWKRLDYHHIYTRFALLRLWSQIKMAGCKMYTEKSLQHLTVARVSL